MKYVYILMLLLSVSVICVLCLPDSQERKIVSKLNEVTGLTLPNNYTAFEYEAPTEFCYVGKFVYNPADVRGYFTKGHSLRDSELLYLTSWGKYVNKFGKSLDISRLSAIEGSYKDLNRWELVYDPVTGEVWFAIGYIMDKPRVMWPDDAVSSRKSKGP